MLVLAGGLGLSTFTFSFLHTAMIRPLPLGEGDRIVRLMRAGGGAEPPGGRRRSGRAARVDATVRELGGYTRREVMLGRDGDAGS